MMPVSLYCVILLFACAVPTIASPTWVAGENDKRHSKFTWPPQVKSAQILGNASDDRVNRDSCGTVRIYDRALWVCRDTQPNIGPGQPQLYPVYSSSASWADFHLNGTPSGHLYGGNYEPVAYYPYDSDECPPPGPLSSQCPATGSCPGPLNLEGLCSDREKRYALWPDTPPLQSEEPSAWGTEFIGYTWLKKVFIGLQLQTYVNDPATSLYKVTYNLLDLENLNPNTLPKTELVDEEFWPENGLPYGDYGNVVKDGVAYMLAQPSNRNVALARVPADSMTDKSKYEYYVNGSWTDTVPGINDTTINIPNISAGGQGTYFFSYYWNKFVWIGQASPSVTADFYITAADKMEGPWEIPYHFYTGINGDYFLSAYSLVAHPALSPGGEVTNDEIYISYTKNDAAFGTNVYTQPLIRITWES